MSILDQASLASIRAQLAHLRADLRRLPVLQYVPPAKRPAAIDVMFERVREIEALAHEAARLVRKLRRERGGRPKRWRRAVQALRPRRSSAPPGHQSDR